MRASIRRFYWFVFALLCAVGARPAWCGDNPITLRAEPCFVGTTWDGVFPVAVTITNRGLATPAVLTVPSSFVGAPPIYERRIALPASDKVRIILNLTHRRDTSDKFELQSPYGMVSDSLTTWTSSFRHPIICLLGESYDALSPLPETLEKSIRKLPLIVDGEAKDAYSPAYLKPQNAPDRAAGYDGISTLVVGKDADRLTSAQWRAIREWVVSGHALIVLGGKGLTDVSPELAEMLPVNVAAGVSEPFDSRLRTNFPVSSIGPLGDLTLPVATSDFYPAQPKADAIVLDAKGRNSYSGTVYARRLLGVGTVTYLGVDLTDSTFRSSNSLCRTWEHLRTASAPLVSAGHLRDLALERATSLFAQSDAAERAGATFNVFHLPMPRLDSVVYLFLGYFLLVVPVTFVVLKRMRRMNLAWVTAPVFAIIFAGLQYTVTARMYTAPLSRRTSGILTASAGDRAAHFAGTTELYFPHGGSYAVRIPQADSLRTEGYGAMGDEAQPGVVDADAGLYYPTLDVPNLALRSINHSQTVDWGTGLTADLRLNADEWTMAGTIENGTGRTLRNARVLVTLSNTSRWRYGIVKIGYIVPGKNVVHGTLICSGGLTDDMFPFDQAYMGANYRAFPDLAAPILMADTSGADLGPALGTDFGGDHSVTVLVSLPALKQ